MSTKHIPKEGDMIRSRRLTGLVRAPSEKPICPAADASVGSARSATFAREMIEGILNCSTECAINQTVPRVIGVMNARERFEFAMSGRLWK
jgi:hypothetical protein